MKNIIKKASISLIESTATFKWYLLIHNQPDTTVDKASLLL